MSVVAKTRRPRVHTPMPPPAKDPFQQGCALAAAGRWDDALAAFRRAVRAQPRSAQGLAVVAACLEAAGRHGELVDIFRLADLPAMREASVHVQLGIALTRLGRFQEAVAALLDAVVRDPRASASYAQLGNVFQLMKMPEEARESFRNALAFGWSPVEMASAILFCSLEAASWDGFDRDLATLNDLVARGLGQPRLFYCLNFSWSRQQLLAAARAQAERVARDILPLPPAQPRPPQAPIRIGYVSSDFHEHATAYLIAELFEQHDRDRFEIHAYSTGENDRSAMRQRIEAAFGRNFVEARRMPDADLARRIRSDGIDVLVDLKGYTLYARSEVFAYRAAPLQVNFLGFPGSLGSPRYDYIIGDPVVTPLGHADGYDEKIAQLPHCYQPNDRRRPLPPATPREALGLPPDAFVFCSFNSNYKISPAMFALWCELLREVEGSVLWLYVSNDKARQNLRAQAARLGIAPDRLFWAQNLPLEPHLARLQAADLFLDTFPVNAHTTASDALWAGLPLVTLQGDTFAARVAASLLHAADAPHLVASSPEEYRRIALDLARDRGQLAAVRARLIASRLTCPLFDSQRYARHFEDLVGRMVQRQRHGLAPDHLGAAST